ncbi:hypothetical protein [Streptomyces sp. KL116D]|uniref:hypothetical protein n=1 Tax=Streptomyces sp. KL116D TaxID=3045152 RepID=UPI0035580895
MDGSGFDADPVLVHLRNEKVRKLEAVTGDVVLRESMYDPSPTLPVRTWSRSPSARRPPTRRAGSPAGQRPGPLPYIHQR